MQREGFLVSGGSGGIGGALCRGLADIGFRPYVGYARHEARAREIAAACGGTALALDLAQAETIDDAIARLAAEEGGLAGIVLAASPPPSLTPLGRVAEADLERHWRINVLGPHRLVAGLVRSCFLPKKRGIVVGVLSRAVDGLPGEGKVPPAGRMMGAYAIAKYGQAGLLSVLAADYPWLVVRAVSPGFTRTRMLEAFDPRFLALHESTQPIRSPEEVAGDILALIA